MDGVTVNDADKGGIIKLEITGFNERIFTTWHSYFDTDSVASCYGFCNGQKLAITVPAQLIMMRSW